MAHSYALRVLTVFTPIMMVVGCGPQPVSKRASQEPASGETTTSTTEYGPKSGPVTSDQKQTLVKQALVRLMQFPGGALILSGVRPKGFEDILPAPAKVVVSCTIDLQSSEDIRSKNGHSGGGIKKNDKGGYTIFANQGVDVDTLAHVIRHEMHHIVEDTQIDVLYRDPEYAKLGERVVSAMLTRKREAINGVQPDELEYMLSMLMCTEIRAYETNRSLEQDGLPFKTFSFASESIELLVNERYLVPYFRKFPDEYAMLTGKECLAQKTLLDYHKLIWKRLLAPQAH